MNNTACGRWGDDKGRHADTFVALLTHRVMIQRGGMAASAKPLFLHLQTFATHQISHNLSNSTSQREVITIRDDSQNKRQPHLIVAVRLNVATKNRLQVWLQHRHR